MTSSKIEVQKVPNLGSFYSQRVQGSLDQHAIIQCCTRRVQVTGMTDNRKVSGYIMTSPTCNSRCTSYYLLLLYQLFLLLICPLPREWPNSSFQDQKNIVYSSLKKWKEQSG